MDLTQGRPVGIRRNHQLPVDLGMEDFVHDAIDAPDADPDAASQPCERKQREKHDSTAGQMSFVEYERVDCPGGERKLVERKTAKRPADVLLPVQPHERCNLRPEPGADLFFSLGFVGQEVDRGEFDRLEECRGLRAG